MIKFFDNIKSEKKWFYTFLLVHFAVWFGVALIRAVLPADSLEGIYWGSLLDFGSPKHPPLAAWITYFSYIPFKADWSIYFISQFFIVSGFIYTYRLARYFLDENKSMLSVIVLEGCWIYSYITGYYGFNPDVVLMFTLPAITYYFYNCMKDNKGSDWIKMGVLVGLSCLNKYQTILLVIGMAQSSKAQTLPTSLSNITSQLIYATIENRIMNKAMANPDWRGLYHFPTKIDGTLKYNYFGKKILITEKIW